jgi:hypothetical protein
VNRSRSSGFVLVPFLLLVLATTGATSAGRQTVVRAGNGPILYNLRVWSGAWFAGDRRLLATVSPNGDGRRDRAVVLFRLKTRATVTMHVVACGKHTKWVRTVKARFGPGRHSLVWEPRAGTPSRTYLLLLKATGPGGARRVYGSLNRRLDRLQPAPVVRVMGIDAGFTRRSYSPGALARLRIATDVPAFTLQLFQAGPETQPTTGGEMQGVQVSEPTQVDWSAHDDARATIGVRLGDWPNGIYFARLTAPDGQTYYAPLIVRPHRYGQSRIAVVLHTNTWEAYNHQDVDGDGWGDTWYANDAIRTVDLTRPYIGRGAPPKWRMYDLPFLRWLYRTHKTVDFLSDDDLERFGSADALAQLYDLIVFPGHEEYVTRHAYDLVTGYRNLGGNLMFLSATNFMWRVAHRGRRITRIARWRQLGRPEARLVGVQYRGNDEGQHHGRYVLSPFGRFSWEFAGVDEKLLSRWHWFGIEYDMTTRASPHGIHILGRVNPHMRARRLRGEMTYYRRGGAKVFAAGTLNFPASLVYPEFRILLGNLWQRLATP